MDFSRADAVFQMEQFDAVVEVFDDFDLAVLEEVRGPVDVQLEFDFRAEFRVDVVFQFAVEIFEFMGMVVLRENQAGRFDFVGDDAGSLRRPLDGVQIFEFSAAVAADDQRRRSRR